MQFSESAPQTTPGTGLKAKAPRKKFFLLGCVIIFHSYQEERFKIGCYYFIIALRNKLRLLRLLTDILSSALTYDVFRSAVTLSKNVAYTYFIDIFYSPSHQP
jgi:hypothetical protein